MTGDLKVLEILIIKVLSKNYMYWGGKKPRTFLFLNYFIKAQWLKALHLSERNCLNKIFLLILNPSVLLTREFSRFKRSFKSKKNILIIDLTLIFDSNFSKHWEILETNKVRNYFFFFLVNISLYFCKICLKLTLFIYIF